MHAAMGFFIIVRFLIENNAQLERTNYVNLSSHGGYVDRITLVHRTKSQPSFGHPTKDILSVTNFVVGDVAIGIDHSLRAAASFICDHKEKSDERRYRYPR